LGRTPNTLRIVRAFCSQFHRFLMFARFNPFLPLLTYLTSTK
jgi:hypothetical protein